MKKILRDLSQPEIFNACTSIDLDRFLGEYNVESNQIQCLKKVIITRKTLSSNSTNLENNNSETCCVSESPFSFNTENHVTYEPITNQE